MYKELKLALFNIVKVSFQKIARVKVTNWKTFTHHFIEVDSDYESFLWRVFSKFEDEAEELDCSLFVVEGDQPVTNRTRITADNYESFLANGHSHQKQTIYFFNDKNSPQDSPQCVPIKRRNLDEDRSSHSSGRQESYNDSILPCIHWAIRSNIFSRISSTPVPLFPST